MCWTYRRSISHLLSLNLICFIFPSDLPAPKPIKFLAVQTDSVHLVWGVPEGATVPQGYAVTWNSEADQGSLNMPGNNIYVQHLIPGEEYTFSVSALYDGRKSPYIFATTCTGIISVLSNALKEIN